ncbi:phosphate acyltransferase PlsX [Fusobacterium gastrosuis]|uniref:phosphate acyltransferase PlsX n=1 Tax=Fusobacterium gastrosuis TaxID=1755100 RepID=UPI001F4F7D6D|nr:phosphate acyltransferase PlsX [Fusobacterium gastrosuis]MDD7391486.1 phosphate acyltransferase PlsX [Fusobacteriaceae bacterium]MDD7410279.1 phosphate acyltransferase PlsX [Fusobacteriaceae bacterium]MDY5306061.1 phosphate acyltransferase PlsX [Fusobacterium gastrosuis]MDY5713928.1 phosphate acyltransferase PlsX [Fusobacterium gastrosuis]MDY5794378.1 phosphate acyltransferase PlsX [Fusobacterium gastrosuis]
MKIALDAMSGDYAPIATIRGAIEALNENEKMEIVLVGKNEIIKEELKKYKYDETRLEIKVADEVIEMTDDPIKAIKDKKNSSMNVCLDLVKDGIAKASVSCGNTGALLATSQLKLKRIKGVLRPAIAVPFPNKKGNTLFLDLGANADTKPEYLAQFAVMGSKYMEILSSTKNPKVALLNIGEEETKGNELTREAFELLKKEKNINFVGNIESTKIMDGDVDVVVTDGFTGNILLKTSEGVGKFIFHIIKESIMENFISKIAALILKKNFKKVKEKVDASEYGGAIFLGLNGLSIKAHGSSDYRAVKNALKVAAKFIDANFIEELRKTMEV